MDLTIALEHRFTRTPDGAVWTATSLSGAHWARYLRCFRRVRLLARVQDVSSSDPRWCRVDSDRVELAPVPHFVGPREYLRSWHAVTRAVRGALDAHPTDAIVLRVPGTIGTVAAGALRSSGRPYGVEVVGDPFEVFAPGSVDHPLRPILRWWSTRELRRLCADASSALYVTASSLQRRYPPPREGGSFSASDVEMGDSAFIACPRSGDTPCGPPFRIVTIGSLAQLYKGTDLLIEAVARCAAAGLDAELVVVGDGRFRQPLEDLAGRLRISSRVRFAGQVPSGAPVRRELDDAHLFVLPSRTEGMPRAIIEAMARGLPCLGSAVGGIPELLPPDALVPLDAGAIAARILQVAGDTRRRAEMSRRNLTRARSFDERVLQPIREEFFRSVIRATERAAEARGGAAEPAPGM